MHQLLDDIVDAFDADNIAQVGELLSPIRARSSQTESQERSRLSDEQSGKSAQSAEGTDFKEAVEV